MRGAIRSIKRSLPNPWQRLIEFAYSTVRAPKLPELFQKRTYPKQGYVEWLLSPEVPPSKYLRRARIRVGLRRLAVHVPPSQRVKAKAIRAHARRFGTRTFVETGTFRGETVTAVAGSFNRRVTIELSPELWHTAQRALPGVECLLGDSGELLKRIVPELTEPALFWLDAHASGGETVNTGVGPIFDELKTIFASGLPHVILIDDARGHRVEAIRQTIPADFNFVVKNDMIRIAPKQPATSPS